MALTVEKTSFEKTKFEPQVRAEGLSLKFEAAPYEHPSGKGSMEAASIDFSPSDAGKLFYLSLVRRKGPGLAPAAPSYHLIVQSPAVLKPMVPELDPTIDVLFTIGTGSVSEDGASINATIRHFSY